MSLYQMHQCCWHEIRIPHREAMLAEVDVLIRVAIAWARGRVIIIVIQNLLPISAGVQKHLTCVDPARKTKKNNWLAWD